jgi:hypothetical protein
VDSAFSLRFISTFSRMQWLRGLRAGLAVGCLMFTLPVMGRPTGWAAFGVLLTLNVDNGGPYRSRFGNMITVLVGGTIAFAIAAIASTSFSAAMLATSLFCFGVTFARVVSQPLASGSAQILICYFVSYGAMAHAPGLSGPPFCISSVEERGQPPSALSFGLSIPSGRPVMRWQTSMPSSWRSHRFHRKTRHDSKAPFIRPAI